MVIHFSWESILRLLPSSLILLGLLGAFFLISTLACRYRREPDVALLSPFQKTILFVAEVAKNPLLFLIATNFFINSAIFCCSTFPELAKKNNFWFFGSADYLLKVSMIIGSFWIFLNCLNKGRYVLAKWLLKNKHPTLNVLLSMVNNSLKAAIILLLINIIIPKLGFTNLSYDFFEKLARVALILIFSWLFIQIIDGTEKIIFNQYNANDLSSMTTRKISTQVTVLKRVVLWLAMIIAFASILMVFDSVKRLGEGLLTTAGVVSAIVAFASQKSLAQIFSGLHLAFTQTIRIGDSVIIDNEFGQIEEITLSYIVVKLWDLRRLILPSDYFSNRSFQNLTLSSTDLLGSIFLYVDYSLSVDVVREKLEELLSQSKLWNRKLGILQVTDMQAEAMELRALVSADSASQLWDLRCEIREGLIKFIVKNYPNCLVKKRTVTVPDHKLENVDA